LTNLVFLLMMILLPVSCGLAITIMGLRNDLRLRRGIPYRPRGPASRAERA